MTNTIEDVICPNKNCSDVAYLVYIKDYLIPSIYNETLFNNVLLETPQAATFLLGKNLFNLFNIIIESYRKHSNYKHLSNIDPDRAKNFKYLLTQNKKAFNTSLEKLEDLIVRRNLEFDSIITYLKSLTTVTDNLENAYVINDNLEIKSRINYIIEMVKVGKNVFANSVISYKSAYDSTPIG